MKAAFAKISSELQRFATNFRILSNSTATPEETIGLFHGAEGAQQGYNSVTTIIQPALFHEAQENPVYNKLKTSSFIIEGVREKLNKRESINELEIAKLFFVNSGKSENNFEIQHFNMSEGNFNAIRDTLISLICSMEEFNTHGFYLEREDLLTDLSEFKFNKKFEAADCFSPPSYSKDSKTVDHNNSGDNCFKVIRPDGTIIAFNFDAPSSIYSFKPNYSEVNYILSKSLECTSNSKSQPVLWSILAKMIFLLKTCSGTLTDVNKKYKSHLIPEYLGGMPYAFVVTPGNRDEPHQIFITCDCNVMISYDSKEWIGISAGVIAGNKPECYEFIDKFEKFYKDNNYKIETKEQFDEIKILWSNYQISTKNFRDPEGLLLSEPIKIARKIDGKEVSCLVITDGLGDNPKLLKTLIDNHDWSVKQRMEAIQNYQENMQYGDGKADDVACPIYNNRDL